MVAITLRSKGRCGGRERGIDGGPGPGQQRVRQMEINSNPKGAEIEIDGAFAGTTPRTKRLGPGEYKIKITINGYKSWERKIRVEAGEKIPIAGELQKNGGRVTAAELRRRGAGAADAERDFSPSR